MKRRITAIAFLVALAIPAAAGAASLPTIEPTSVEYPNLALTADKNEVAVEGIATPGDRTTGPIAGSAWRETRPRAKG